MGKSKIDMQIKIQRAIMTFELISFHRKNDLGHPSIDEYIDESIGELKEVEQELDGVIHGAMPEVADG